METASTGQTTTTTRSLPHVQRSANQRQGVKRQMNESNDKIFSDKLSQELDKTQVRSLLSICTALGLLVIEKKGSVILDQGSCCFPSVDSSEIFLITLTTSVSVSSSSYLFLFPYQTTTPPYLPLNLP